MYHLPNLSLQECNIKIRPRKETRFKKMGCLCCKTFCFSLSEGRKDFLDSGMARRGVSITSELTQGVNIYLFEVVIEVVPT